MIHAIHTDKQHPDGGQVSWVGQCGAEVVDDSSMVAATDLLKLGEFTGAGGSRILCSECMEVLVRIPSVYRDKEGSPVGKTFR